MADDKKQQRDAKKESALERAQAIAERIHRRLGFDKIPPVFLILVCVVLELLDYAMFYTGIAKKVMDKLTKGSGKGGVVTWAIRIGIAILILKFVGLGSIKDFLWGISKLSFSLAESFGFLVFMGFILFLYVDFIYNTVVQSIKLFQMGSAVLFFSKHGFHQITEEVAQGMLEKGGFSQYRWIAQIMPSNLIALANYILEEKKRPGLARFAVIATSILELVAAFMIFGFVFDGLPFWIFFGGSVAIIFVTMGTLLVMINERVDSLKEEADWEGDSVGGEDIKFAAIFGLVCALSYGLLNGLYWLLGNVSVWAWILPWIVGTLLIWRFVWVPLTRTKKVDEEDDEDDENETQTAQQGQGSGS